MTTAAKLVQPIAICLAYLIQLDVPQLPWKQKGGFKIILDSFHQTS
jgi:hypothetical protein